MFVKAVKSLRRSGKKFSILFLVLFLASPAMVVAQINVSTHFKKEANWNEKKGSWELKSKKEEDHSFFEFNQDFTWFKHTTKNNNTAFLIKSHEKMKEGELYKMNVVDDVGNQYDVILNVENKTLRFLYQKDGEKRLTQYAIKKVWKDD